MTAVKTLRDRVIALLEAENVSAALPLAQRLETLAPRDAGVLFLVAETLRRQGQPAAALERLDRAVTLSPEVAGLHYRRGVCLEALDRYPDALAAYEKAHALAPDDPAVANDLGSLLLYLEAPARAELLFHAALALDPDMVPAKANLGAALRALGRLDEAVRWCEAALAQAPEDPVALTNLGLTLVDQGRARAAVPVLEKVWQADPEGLGPALNLGMALKAAHQPGAAVSVLEAARARHPHVPELAINLSAVLLATGEGDAAHEVLCRAVAGGATSPGVMSSLMFLRPYAGLVDPGEEVALARLAAESCGAPAHPAPRAAQPRQPLRVGFLSHNLLAHPVARFLLPVWQALDPARVTVMAFSTHPHQDEITAALKAAAGHWDTVAGLSDAALVEHLRARGLDVLVEMAGYTETHRLGAVGQRVAPVQAHWLGYAATTGVPAMDYWIGDAVLSPPECQAGFTETLWPLPRCWLACPVWEQAPPVAWTPAADETVVLGSFNDLGKMTAATWAAWGEILRRLPEARLLLSRQTLRDARARHQVLARLAAEGVEADRVRFNSDSPSWVAHMAWYNQVDVALDPLGGAGGGTTTAEALWMGVPVVTRLGSLPAQRMSASMLEALGRSEWIAESDAAYVETVVALARDPEQRRALRARQRETMAASPLCDAVGLARALEDAFTAMHAGRAPSRTGE